MSAADQNEARPVEAIGVVDRLYSETVSGKSVDNRAQLKGRWPTSETAMVSG